MTLYPSFFCHLHLCSDLSFNLSIAFGSFWLASHFFQVSSLVTKIKDLRGNPELPLPTLLAKKFSFYFSHCLVEVGDHGVQISICKATTYSCIALINLGSFSFSRSNQILGWVGFLDFLRQVWKVIITISWSLLAVLIPERNRFFTKM